MSRLYRRRVSGELYGVVMWATKTGADAGALDTVVSSKSENKLAVSAPPEMLFVSSTSPASSPSSLEVSEPESSESDTSSSSGGIYSSSSSLMLAPLRNRE